MKNCKNAKKRGLLIFRLLIGGIFLYHGLSKIGADENMINFVGGAAHGIGLTFLSMKARFTIAMLGEIVAGALFILGLRTRVASILVIIIMLVAMSAKGRARPRIEMDLILAVLALGLVFTGAGKIALSSLRCKACATGDMKK